LGFFGLSRYLDGDRSGLGEIIDLYGRDCFIKVGIASFPARHIAFRFIHLDDTVNRFPGDSGVGRGALVPLAMTIIGDIFTLRERAKMQALFSGVWGLSSVVGPVVGGFITDQISWRWVFFINLPVGVVAAMIIGFALKEPPPHEKPTIDYAEPRF
jgi:MFS family permease